MKFKKFASLLLTLALMLTALPLFEQTAKAATDYYIEVDITNQIVTVFQAGNHTESGIVRQMICSTGKSGSSTPRGTFTLPKKRYSSERTEWHRVNGGWAQWCTRITGSILFHSLPVTNKKSPPSAATVAALGSPASHGCVRLRVHDAKWIALNCPTGTKVKIYKSGKRNDELRKLLLDGEFYAANESYDEYLGIAGALGKGDAGEKVLLLQARLNLLGYGAGAANGTFGAETHAAVCAFQKVCGLAQTGRVTEKLWNRIFANDAPYAPIQSGSSGGHVLALQNALKTLKLYDGEANGVYDDATANAVRLYQSAFGLTVDGKATTSIQKSILAKAEQVKAQFGDSEYKATVVSTTKQLAKVKVNSSLNLRASATTSSKSLAKLKNGTVVTVLKKGSSWSQVQHGSIVGYCKNTYLRFYTESATTLDYEVVEPEPTPTVTPDATADPEPTEEPVPTETPVPTEEPTAVPVTPTPEPTASSETLTIGSTGSAVANLQRALKTLKLYSGEITGTYDQATADAVKTFQSVSGLTVNGKATPAVQDAILKKARALKDEFGDADYEPVFSTTSTTMAKVKVNSRLNLRASASTSSKVLGKLKNGTVVTVLKKGSSWSQVNANGLVGYCKNTYLRFSTVTSSTLTYEPLPTATPEPTVTPESTATPVPDATQPSATDSVPSEPTGDPDSPNTTDDTTSAPTGDPDPSDATDDATSEPTGDPDSPDVPSEPTGDPDSPGTTDDTTSDPTGDPDSPGATDDAPSEPTGNPTPSSAADNVTSDCAAPTAKPESKPLYAVVKGDAKLYRSAEASDANLAGEAAEGAVYDVVEADAQWTQVRVNGKVLFIPTRNVNITTTKPAQKPIATPTVVPEEATAQPSQIPAEASEAPAAEDAASI